MTKEEFLRRCETIWNMGFMKDRSMSNTLRDAADTYMRIRAAYVHNPQAFAAVKMDYQGSIAVETLSRWIDNKKVLAADIDVEKAYQFAHILDHPCQFCAEDKGAWHSRYSFCDHRRQLQ